MGASSIIWVGPLSYHHMGASSIIWGWNRPIGLLHMYTKNAGRIGTSIILWGVPKLHHMGKALGALHISSLACRQECIVQINRGLQWFIRVETKG